MPIQTNKKQVCKRGINKANGFPGCGSEAYKKTYGLCDSCLYDWYSTTEAGKIEFEKRKGYLKVKKVKEEKKETREQKNKLKNWSAELQNKINIIVRLIDKDLPCLATGKNAKQIHAGHVYARGGNQTIRFNLHNIHRQSAQSNHWQNDDGRLREGIVNEYGQEYMDFISNLRRTPQLKYTNEEYHQFYKKASEIVLKMQKEDKRYNKADRKIMRNLINIQLGIYDLEYCCHDKPF